MTELRLSILERGPQQLLTSEAALLRALDDAAFQARAVNRLNVVFLTAPNGDELSMVVGGKETVLGFTYGHREPPYYASVGAATTIQPVLTAFTGLVNHTEFPRRSVVPMDDGRRAAAEFLASGMRPLNVVWIEV